MHLCLLLGDFESLRELVQIESSPNDAVCGQADTHDCTAHSAIYSPGSNKIRPLFIFTDTWCSSGQFDGSGKMVQTGGDADGVAKVNSLFIICVPVVTAKKSALEH